VACFYISYLDYIIEMIMVSIRADATRAEVDKYIVGNFGEVSIMMLELVVAVMNAPWPEATSNHPWSTVFMKWWARISGPFIVNWVDSGTRNHIMHLAKCVNDNFIIIDREIVELVLISHAPINPPVTIIRGVTLISVGRINELILSKVIHLIALPAVIDSAARSKVGLIILISSLIDINELHRLGPQRTASLKRIE